MIHKFGIIKTQLHPHHVSAQTENGNEITLTVNHCHYGILPCVGEPKILPVANVQS